MVASGDANDRACGGNDFAPLTESDDGIDPVSGFDKLGLRVKLAGLVSGSDSGVVEENFLCRFEINRDDADRNCGNGLLGRTLRDAGGVLKVELGVENNRKSGGESGVT